MAWKLMGCEERNYCLCGHYSSRSPAVALRNGMLEIDIQNAKKSEKKIYSLYLSSFSSEGMIPYKPSQRSYHLIELLGASCRSVIPFLLLTIYLENINYLVFRSVGYPCFVHVGTPWFRWGSRDSKSRTFTRAH